MKSHLSNKDSNTHAKMRETLLSRSLKVDIRDHSERVVGGREDLSIFWDVASYFYTNAIYCFKSICDEIVVGRILTGGSGFGETYKRIALNIR